MAIIDFSKAVQSHSNNNNSGVYKNELLEDGTYAALITKYEKMHNDKGMGVKLTFSVIKPHIGIIKSIPDYLAIGSKNATALTYAFQKCQKITEALKIPYVFDDEIGISEENLDRYILFKKLFVRTKKGMMKNNNGSEFPCNQIIDYAAENLPQSQPLQINGYKTVNQVSNVPSHSDVPAQSVPSWVTEDPAPTTYFNDVIQF